MEQWVGSLCELQVLSLSPRELEGDPEGAGACPVGGQTLLAPFKAQASHRAQLFSENHCTKRPSLKESSPARSR